MSDNVLIPSFLTFIKLQKLLWLKRITVQLLEGKGEDDGDGDILLLFLELYFEFLKRCQQREMYRSELLH